MNGLRYSGNSNRKSSGILGFIKGFFSLNWLRRPFSFINEKTGNKLDWIFASQPYITLEDYFTDTHVVKPLLYKFMRGSSWFKGYDASVGFRIPRKTEKEILNRIINESVILKHVSLVESTGDRTHVTKNNVGGPRWPGEIPAGPAQKEPELEMSTVPVHVTLITLSVTNSAVETNIKEVVNDFVESNIEAMNVGMDQLVLYGDGQGKPAGFYPKDQGDLNKVSTLPEGVTIVVDGNFTSDHLVELKKSLPKQYKKDACWIINTDVGMAVKDFTDNRGRLICVLDENTGLPKRILGIPVIYNEYMDTGDTTNSIPVILADLHKAYTFTYRPQISVRRFSDSFYSELDQFMLLTRYRIGGQVTDYDAVRMLHVLKPTPPVEDATFATKTQEVVNLPVKKAGIQ